MRKLKPLTLPYWLIQLALPTLALFLGGLIYIFCRESEFLFFKWLRNMGLSNWLDVTNDFSSIFYLKFNNWVVFSLPNGLWAFAYAFIITSIWYSSKSVIKIFWILSIPLLILGFEVLQHLDILPGTYSFADVLSGIVGIILGISIGISSFKLYNHGKNR